MDKDKVLMISRKEDLKKFKRLLPIHIDFVNYMKRRVKELEKLLKE